MANFLQRARRRPEWWVILITTGFALYCSLSRGMDAIPADDMFYYQLASYFASFIVLFASLAFGMDAARQLPAGDRKLAAVVYMLLLGGGVAWLLQSYPTPQADKFGRFVEAVASVSLVSLLIICLYFTAGGALPLRKLGALTGRFFVLWGPLLLYLIAGGFCLTWMMEGLDTLWDPVLMRMDLSLGGIPARGAFQFGYGGQLMEWVNVFGYPLLGLLIGLVVFSLYLSGDTFHARRYVLGLVLVACLGLASYVVVPAVGPLYAFEGILTAKASPENQAILERAVDSIISGPSQIRGLHDYARNVFPSLHTAFSLLALIAAWFWRRWLFWLCLPLAIVQFLTAMTTGYHYLVDLIAAFPFVAFCWWLANVLLPGETSTHYPFARVQQNSARWQLAFWVSMALSLILLTVWAWQAPITPIAAYGISLVLLIVPLMLSLMLTRR